jgi:hypothetical protein
MYIIYQIIIDQSAKMRDIIDQQFIIYHHGSDIYYIIPPSTRLAKERRIQLLKVATSKLTSNH